MSTQCLNCWVRVESNWKFCTECGKHVKHVAEKPQHIESEKAPVQGAFSGLLFGVIATPILIIVGTMLCLTGLGAFAGVPMIIAGVFAPLLGPLIGIGTLRGKCPWCGSSVNTVANSLDFGCHACSGRIHVADRQFVREA